MQTAIKCLLKSDLIAKGTKKKMGEITKFNYKSK